MLKDYSDDDLVTELRRRLLAIAQGICYGCKMDLNDCTCNRGPGNWRSPAQVLTALQALRSPKPDSPPQAARTEQPAASSQPIGLDDTNIPGHAM